MHNKTSTALTIVAKDTSIPVRNTAVTITAKLDGGFLVAYGTKLLAVPREVMLEQRPQWANEHDRIFGPGNWGQSSIRSQS